jgi:hypothetical protein
MTMIHRINYVKDLLEKTKSYSLTARELLYLHDYPPEIEFQVISRLLCHVQAERATLEYCICLTLAVFTNISLHVMEFDHVVPPYFSQCIAILVALGGQAGVDDVQHGFHGSQFHPHGADAAHGVVAVGERHDRVGESYQAV